MIRLYSDERTAAVIEELAPLIAETAADYGVPAACIKAVLFREIREIDMLDLMADAAVRLGLFGRNDSSTGYMQIFSRVAIRALDFAEARGIESAERLGVARPLSAEDPRDVRRIWLRLNRDRAFNLRMGTLNLLAAADEVVGSSDFTRFSPDEIKRAFSRYNSSSGKITAYGEETYGYYLRFGQV